MTTVSHNVYFRPDGVIGVGFEIDFAGRRQHSVAWPDRKAERFMQDELDRLSIAITSERGLPANPSRQATSIQSEGLQEVLQDEAAEIDREIANEEALQEVLRDEAEYEAALDRQPIDPVDDVAPESEPSTAAPEPADQPTADAGTTDGEVAEHSPEDAERSSTDDSAEQPQLSEAEAIRQFLADNSAASNGEVIEALAANGYQVNSSQVSRQRKRMAGRE